MDLNYPALVCVALITLIFVIPSWLYIEYTERRARREHEAAIKSGRNQPVTIQPFINLGTCMGSGACVTACPEDVLKIIDGQAVAVSMSACVGHGVCVTACPVDAIELVFGSEKRGIDIPEVDGNFETNVKGLFVAGELGGMGLIANAADQGVRAAEYAIEGLKPRKGQLDLAIVGAGPAGLAAALEAKRRGHDFVLLEQGEVGGAVIHFPRKKLVFTRPMELPLYGKVNLRSMLKEQLVDLFRDVVDKTDLKVSTQERVDAIQPQPSGGFSLKTSKRNLDAQRVILALGRRGTPRTLRVPGEESEKVAYSLLEPEHYTYDHILVVGGGDSAVEAACTLGEQEGNKVSLSYRGSKINRPKKKNVERLRDAVRNRSVELLLESNVREIGEDRVVLTQSGEQVVIPNDYVFVFVGGVLPTEFLKKAGVRIRQHFGKRVVELGEEPPREEPDARAEPVPARVPSLGDQRVPSRSSTDDPSTLVLHSGGDGGEPTVALPPSAVPGGDVPTPFEMALAPPGGGQETTVHLPASLLDAQETTMHLPETAVSDAQEKTMHLPESALPNNDPDTVPLPDTASVLGNQSLSAPPNTQPVRTPARPAPSRPSTFDVDTRPVSLGDPPTVSLSVDEVGLPGPGPTSGEQTRRLPESALPEGLGETPAQPNPITVPGRVVATKSDGKTGQMDRIAFGKLPAPSSTSREETDNVMPMGGALADLSQMSKEQTSHPRGGYLGGVEHSDDTSSFAAPDESAGENARLVKMHIQVAQDHLKRNSFQEVADLAYRIEALVGEAAEGLGERDITSARRQLAILQGEAALGLGDADQALRHFERAVSIARTEGSPDVLGASLLLLGRAAYSSGRHDKARVSLEEASRTWRPGLEERAALAQLLGQLALHRADVDGAQEQWQRALSSAAEASARGPQAQAQLGLAECAATRGELPQALELLREAEGWARLANPVDHALTAEILGRGVQLDLAAGQYASALHRVEQLLEVVTDHGLSEHRATVASLLAHTMMRVGFASDASDAALQSVEFARSLPPTASVAPRERAARVLCELGRSAEADQALAGLPTPPEGVLDDPVGRRTALLARVAASTDAARGKKLANDAMGRPTPLSGVHGAQIRLDAAHALLQANQASAARAAVKRGLKLIQGSNAKGLKLELLLAFHQAEPEDRVAEAAARTAIKLMEPLPDHARRAFGEREAVHAVLRRWQKGKRS